MPGSTHDNILIKDANSANITMRAMDISAVQDGSKQRSLILSSSYPVDYGAGSGLVGGCFQTVIKSGNVAAGLAAVAPVFSFRNSSSTLNLILRRLRINAWTLGTGFAAGLMTFDLYAARSFTVSDTGGAATTLSSKSGAMRAGIMSNSAVGDLRAANTGALTPGTRALDATPLATWAVAAPASAYSPAGPFVLFERLADEHPFVMGQNEGFVIQATVPATGVWGFQVTPAWDEVPLVNY